MVAQRGEHGDGVVGDAAVACEQDKRPVPLERLKQLVAPMGYGDADIDFSLLAVGGVVGPRTTPQASDEAAMGGLMEATLLAAAKRRASRATQP
jgi:hypothetical protein